MRNCLHCPMKTAIALRSSCSTSGGICCRVGPIFCIPMAKGMAQPRCRIWKRGHQPRMVIAAMGGRLAVFVQRTGYPHRCRSGANHLHPQPGTYRSRSHQPATGTLSLSHRPNGFYWQMDTQRKLAKSIHSQGQFAAIQPGEVCTTQTTDAFYRWIAEEKAIAFISFI